MREIFKLLSPCLMLVATCTAAVATGNSSGNAVTNVLFIGNSLTYTNDLPGTLAGIAASANIALNCESVTRPGYALIDHLDGGSDAVAVIRQGGWNYVIIQQGPSSLDESRVILIDGTVRFDVEIRAVGAVTSLYMVWPDITRFAYFEAVRANYKAAADTVGGLFLPAGEAWLKAWELDPSLPLYGSDNFHPSPMGTFLAALVIYERVTGADAQNLPPVAVVAGDTLNVSEETVRLLQSAAHTTNARYVVTGTEELQKETGIPQKVTLNQNYPNPFNPATTIGFEVPVLGFVSLKVYNVLGEDVATLVSAQLAPGTYSTQWNGSGFPSGVYVYRLQVGAFVEAKNLMLMR